MPATSWRVTFYAGLVSMVTAVPQQIPPIRARLDLVEVGVVVTDHSGRPVQGLTQEDFEIREDGRPVKIVVFVGPKDGRQAATGGDQQQRTMSTGNSGRFVVILLDDIFVGPVRTTKVREIARQFIDRMSGEDQVGVVRLNGDHSATTTSRERALAAVAAYTHDRPPDPGTAEEFRLRVDHAMDTVADLAKQLGAVQHRRKALVFVGAPLLFVPTVPGVPSGYSQSWFGALRALARANVSLYYIDPRGLVHDVSDITRMTADDPSRMDSGDPLLDHGKAFASGSGGMAFVNTNAFDRAVEQIWREAADYYLLGYEAPVVDENTHTISVQVRRRGVEVRARKTR